MQNPSVVTVGILSATIGCALLVGVVTPGRNGDATPSRKPWADSAGAPSIHLQAPELDISEREREFRRTLSEETAPLLQALVSEAGVVEGTLEANRQNTLTPREIEALDQRWRSTIGLSDPLVRECLEHPVTERFWRALEEQPRWKELFLMDARGCVIAETHKTSDYWQGDESKWIDSFAGGEGGIHVGQIEFDTSIQGIVLQVCVPVLDSQQRAIGVICTSLATDE